MLLAALGSGAAYALSAEVGGALTQEHDALAVAHVHHRRGRCCYQVLVPGGLGLAMVRGQSIGDGGCRVLGAGRLPRRGHHGLRLRAPLRRGYEHPAPALPSLPPLMEPVTAVLVAVLLLGETLSVAGGVGCLLILGGHRRSGTSYGRARRGSDPLFVAHLSCDGDH